MKYALTLMFFISFTASANPLFSVKDRLRLYLWTHGLEERPLTKKNSQKIHSEEIERPLRKI